jgi:hypothetical protein
MKWRPRGDSQDLDLAPDEAVGERLATSPNRRVEAGRAMCLSSVCLGETNCFIASDGQ